MITINNLTKVFGTFKAVDNLTIEIKQGEFYGFLGPNGAGKTTTIKMMTGLYAPSSGTIIIDRFDIQQQPVEAKMLLGYIPDQPFLYEKLTGREFLFFSAGLYKMAHNRTSQRIQELIDLFEIGSWLDQRTENYSQGMRQRIVIAASLLHNPKVLIIDEPMVGLDPRSAHIVKQTLKQQSLDGVTIIMSTHSLHIAEELCDRIGIIKDGRLIFEDSTQALMMLKDHSDGRIESVFLELTK